MSLYCFSCSGDVLRNEANEFFLAFGSNSPCVTGKVDLILFVTTSSLDTVTFTVNTLTNYTYSGNVSLHSPARVVIPTEFMVTNASSSQRQKGIHVKVERNKTVTVFGLNHKEYSTDAYLALPCSHLQVIQYEYYPLTYSRWLDGCHDSFVLLVGCEDSTSITTENHSFTLSRLETYLMSISFTEGRIVSDKPIAFFSGHQCATIYTSNRCGYHIEQLPPTSTWGTFFLGSTGLTTVVNQMFIFYRVLAAYHETTVTVNCGAAVQSNPATDTIHHGGYYTDFTISHSSYPALCVIEASKPVLVVEFQSAQLFSDWCSFMSLIPTTDQYSNQYSLPYFRFNYENYVIINVLPQYFDKKIFVDDSTVSTQWISAKCSNGTVCGYTATLELQSASHFIQHTDRDAKIGAITFGFGNWDAYGCPAGFHTGPFNQGRLMITQQPSYKHD